MSASIPEQIVTAIYERLIGAGMAVEKNSAVPEIVPGDGLAIVRDGNPGEPERLLGGFETAYYVHIVDVELFVQSGSDSVRDQKFDSLLKMAGTALYADKTFGGLAYGFESSRPETTIIPVEGAAAIKAGVIGLSVEYQTDNPLG